MPEILNLDLFWKSGIGICFEKSGSRDSRLPTPGQPERLLSISRPQKPQFHRNSIIFYRLEFRGRWIWLFERLSRRLFCRGNERRPPLRRQRDVPPILHFSQRPKSLYFFTFSGFSGSPGEKKGSPGIPMTYVIFPFSKIWEYFLKIENVSRPRFFRNYS